MLEIGAEAPDFELFDQQHKRHRLADNRGKWVILYFYPKDDTPGCTTEACSIRDHWQDLKTKAVVFGISTDTVNSHVKFAQKYDLSFPLLADDSKVVVNAYQVWVPKKFMGREYMGTLRVTYIINPEGVIAKVYPQVKPAGHAEVLLADLAQLQQENP